jgi:Mitochondrial carrier protein
MMKHGTAVPACLMMLLVAPSWLDRHHVSAWSSPTNRHSAVRRLKGIHRGGRRVLCLYHSSTPYNNKATPSSMSSIVPCNEEKKEVAQSLQEQHGLLENADTTPVAFGSTPDAFPDGLDVPLPLYQLALAGSLTTFFADMMMHPMDSVKTVQQMHTDMNVVAAIQTLWDTAGIAGFYAGFLTYASTDAVSGALKFATYEMWKQRAANASIPVYASNLVGAALAFVASSVTQVPGEFLKNQLQVGHYPSLPDAVQGLYAQGGIASFYTGYEAVLYRDIPYTMLELGLYEITKSIIGMGKKEKSDSVTEIGAAALTGAITAILTTPLDCIKTKIMVDSDYLDLSFAQAAITLFQEHGVLAFFAGVVARVAWIVPFTAVYLPTYDALKRALQIRHSMHQETSSFSDKYT